MRRPVLVLVPTLAILLIAGTPFFRLVQGIPDAFVLPAGLEAREAAVALQDDFQPGTTTPIVVLADVAGSPTAEHAIRALYAFGERLAAVDGVDAVESPFNGLRDPQTGVAMTVDQLVALYALPRDQWPQGLGALYDRFVHEDTVRFDAISPDKPASPTGTAVIPRVRSLATEAPIERVQVGGFAALGQDFLVSQANRIPFAIGITLFAMAVILFLLFGSIVLPVKAIVMTLLSLSASFGALVWIFQEGNFSNVLDFESPGFTIAGNPIIMFCVLFGLSMDYEVLLLSRMQEAYRRHHDNTEAVAEGLSRTARVITGAAVIMVTVFAAFALADTVTIKSIGVGMAIAVAIDATIVRMLLVPATMRLLGDWNWYAPGPLGRFAERLGFSHVEDEATPSAEPAPSGHEGAAEPA
jgi:RND superfamily putative drug exporter